MSTFTLNVFRQSIRLHRDKLSAYRRLMSSGTGKDTDIPTAEDVRGKANPLHDPLQRTGDSFAQTKVTMCSQEEENIYILKYGTVGFKLQTGIRVIGPIAVFPRSMFHWNVNDSDDINEDSLSLFSLLYPKPDVLILGVGDPGRTVNPSVFKYLKAKNISFEVLPTDMACATFNFLNSEHRFVAAGLIPPRNMLADFDESFKHHDIIDPGFQNLIEEEMPGDLEDANKYVLGEMWPKMFGKDSDKVTDKTVNVKDLEKKHTKTKHTKTVDWAKPKSTRDDTSDKDTDKTVKAKDSDRKHTKTVDWEKRNQDK